LSHFFKKRPVISNLINIRHLLYLFLFGGTVTFNNILYEVTSGLIFQLTNQQEPTIIKTENMRRHAVTFINMFNHLVHDLVVKD